MIHRYSLDSNALIEAWMSWYTDKLHPGFWEGLSQLGDNDRLYISEEVLIDLSLSTAGKDDPLYIWCHRIKDRICIPSNKAIQSEVSKLVSKYPGLGGTQIPGEKNYSDPFVIAVAKVFNTAVITHEKPNPKGRRGLPIQHYRIPDVCRMEEIEWSPVYGIIKREQWVFNRTDII